MDEVEEIKRRIDIVDLISQYLTLKKAGANYKALCPFHQEKTPSLMVSPEKQIWHCFGCFSKGTEIVTSKGLEAIEKLKPGDTVMTNKGRLRRVLTLFKRNYNGELFELKVRQTSEPTYLTPDHKVFIIKTKNCKQNARLTRLCQSRCRQNCSTKFFKDYKLEKLPISEAKVNDYLLYPVNLEVVDLQIIRLYDKNIYLSQREHKGGFSARDIPEVIAVDENFLKFLGYWIAEGSVYPRGVRFSLGSHEKEFAKEIAKISSKIFGIMASIHERKGNKTGIEVSISNVHLAKIIVKFCGKGASNKKIPDFCLKLPLNKQKVLLEAIFKGDGTTSKGYVRTKAGRKSITTISNLLAFQMKNFLLRAGVIPVITYKKAYQDSGQVNHRSSWCVSWMPGQKNYYSEISEIDGSFYCLLPIKSIRKRPFYGNVYNLMVEEDSSYVVKNFSVGNCGEGGDIFTFVMKMENLEFREALELLAEKAGVKLQRHKPLDAARGRPDQKNRIFKLNALAARTFHKILLEHPSGALARTYLKNRGITLLTLKDFMVGWAPSSRAMEGFFLKHGFTKDEMEKAGSPERFYKRIIFPIRDVMANTIAFTGRVLDPKQEPKYLNTPETIIFHKSRVLYNLDRARNEIKKANSAIVVEGQMDILASWQAGVKNVVATSGTALTNEHLMTLMRYSPNIIFAFDADTAGLMTAKKAYEMAIIAGFNVKMVNLASSAGEFKDPGEMIAHSPALWQKTVQEAHSVIDWYFNLAFGREKEETTPHEKKEIAKEILPIIKKIPDSIEQGHYIGLLARKLAIAEEAIFDALKKVPLSKRNPEKVQPRQKKLSVEELLLGVIFKNPEKINLIKNRLKTSDFLLPELSAIYKEVLRLYNQDKSITKEKLLSELRKTASRPTRLKIEEIILIAEQEEEAENLEEVIRSIKNHKREDLKKYYAAEIKKAENAKDRQRLKNLIKEFQNAISE